jgi:penicillin amidase
MTRLLRVAATLAAVLVLAVLGVVWLALRSSLPVTTGTLGLPGLSGSVTVIRDHGGVPHIFAGSAADGVRALGFVQAQDRRLQMELSRLVGQGRLAEVVGDRRSAEPMAIAGVLGWSALDIDRQMRTLGLARLAEAEAERLPDAERALFQAYADGVNAATEAAGVTGTVRILGRTPDPWRPADSILVMKLGDLTFSIQRFEELLAASLVAEVGEKGLADLMPPYPEELAPALVDGDGVRTAMAAPAMALPLRLSQPLGPVATGAGSNNWVIHGSRTATGTPILANDPHTEADVALYVAHVSAPGFEVIGTTLCGPTFMQGHNARIAWGITLVGADTQDHFVEQLGPGDQVRRPRGWTPVELRREKIAVRGRPDPVEIEIRETVHGPLVSDLTPDQVRRLDGTENGPGGPGARYALALARTEGTPHPAPSYLGVARAHDWTSFREALRHFPTIPLNFVYADVDGHVGYQMAGRIPRREGRPPLTPVPAWEPGHEWVGEVPFDALPHLLDPPDGVIVTANARIAGPDYPYHLATRWCDVPFRVRRIRALLDAKPKLTLDDVAAVQLDLRNEPMADVVAWARTVASDDSRVRRFQEALAGWDLRADPASMPAALAETLRLELLQTFFAPRMSADHFQDYLWSNAGMQLVALKRIMEDDEARFFGPDPAAARTARTSAIAEAIRRAIARLEATLGPDWNGWSWGRLHTIAFLPPLARGLAPPIARLFEVGPFPAPGSSFTVNAGWWAPARPFHFWIGPMYRQIVDLGDLARSRWTPPPPGQQEQRLSPHYGDLAAPWLAGRYRPMLWTRADVEADAESTLTLVPAS